MMKKVLSLILIFIFLIMASSNCFAQTVSGNNEYYTITVPDNYRIGDKLNSYMADITYIHAYGNYSGTVQVYAYEKEEYDPDLNFNGLYILDGFTQGDLDKDVKKGANWISGYDPEEDTVIYKQLLTINGCPAQRVAWKSSSFYSDAYAIESDNLLAIIYFGWIKDRNFLDSNEEKSIINSFKFKNDTAKNVFNVPFADVETSDWYSNAVRYTYKNNIISGYNKIKFAPNDKLTRGQLVTILHRMEGSPKVTGKTKFSDVQDSSQYYYNAVKWATDKKIVSGYDNGKFGPEDNITREQLAVILWKYAKYKGKSVNATNNLSSFTDTKKISSWALPQMKWAVGAGVISGNKDKTLKPTGNATRAEVAAMLEKYCKKVGR